MQARGSITPDTEFPLETEARFSLLHARTPVDRHLRILSGDARIGDQDFVSLYRHCLKTTQTQVTPFNVFRRFESRLNLVRYFLSTWSVPGARAECGVYRGASALLLCHAARGHAPSYDGAGLFLIDSYEGASASGEHDLIPVRDNTARARMAAFFPHRGNPGWVDDVERVFAAFPAARIVRGWVPEVLSQLPERNWAFVHLEVDLYDPTFGGLEYFYPRLSAGGVIITDDYGPVFTPGGRKAWRDYCVRHEIPYAVLPSGQAVLIKR